MVSTDRPGEEEEKSETRSKGRRRVERVIKWGGNEGQSEILAWGTLYAYRVQRHQDMILDIPVHK